MTFSDHTVPKSTSSITNLRKAFQEMRTRAYSYSDICLVPKHSNVQSRSMISTDIKLGERVFALPIIPANMKCVIDTNLAIELMNERRFYIMHRFGDTVDFIEKINKSDKVNPDTQFISISVGVTKDDEALLIKIHNLHHKIDYITVDVAHGDHERAGRMVEYIKWLFSKHPKGVPFVIAGNVATPEAVTYLEKAGANAVKVGIGPGRACTTYLMTGFMSPMFSTIQECATVAKVPLIADGGTQNPGDIAKALVAGASMVMIGAQFTACIDSPAKTVYLPGFNENVPWYKRWWWALLETINRPLPTEAKDGVPYIKEYYGSASQYNRGNTKNIEGTLVKIQGNNLTYALFYQFIKEHLQSSVSYAGGFDLTALDSVEYRIHSP